MTSRRHNLFATTMVMMGFVFLAAPVQAADPSGISYGGRLTDAAGKPLSGTRDLEIKFFDDDTDGSPVGPTKLIDDVELVQGVFQISIELNASERDLVLGTGAPVYMQIKDLKTGKAYPRQTFGAVPYALRVPVDGVTLDYNGNGELAVQDMGGVPQSDLTLDGSNGDVELKASSDPTAVPYALTMPKNAGVDQYVLTTDGAGMLTWTAKVVGGGGDMSKTENLFGLTNYATARSNIGLAIGTDVEAHDATLTGMAATAPTANQMIYATGADAFATLTSTVAGRDLLTAANAGAQKTLLGVIDPTNTFVQADAQNIGTDEIRARDGGGLKLYDDGNNGIFVEDGGRVGIGTTTPNLTLHVHTPTAGLSQIQITNADAGTTASDGVAIGLDATERAIVWNGENTDMSFFTNAANRMTIAAGGNVGIGTPSPGAALDVKGTLRLSGSTSGYVGFAPPVVAGTTTYTLPSAPVGGGYLTTDGAGLLTWGTPTGSSGLQWDGGATNLVAATGRTSLGLVIGSNVQAYDAQLDDLAVLTPTDNGIIVGNGTNFVLEAGNTMRTSLGLAIGTDVQAYDAQLADVAGLAVTDNNFIVGNGTNFVVESGATARTSMGAQAADPTLTGVAATTVANNDMLLANGADTFTTLATTTAGRNMLTAADVNAQKTLLGISGYTDVANSFTQADAQYIGTDEIRARDVDGLKLYDDGGNGIFVKDGGNVGIGTTTPSNGKLNVWGDALAYGTANVVMTLQDTNAAALGVGAGLSFGAVVSAGGLKVSDMANIKGIKENATDANYASALVFSTRANVALPTEAMRISSSGNLGVGTTSPATKLHVAGGAGASDLALDRASADSAGSDMNFYKSRGSQAGKAIVSSGDALGSVMYRGYDGASNIIAAHIVGGVDGTPGTNDMPGRLMFYTTPDGSASSTERMRIDQAGNVGVGATAAAGAKLQVNGAIVGGYFADTDAAIDWKLGNIQSTSVAPASTLNFTSGSMIDGGSYTLALTNTTGGNYTLGVAGDITTWKCIPACAGGVVTTDATKHTVLTILKMGTTGYVSWIKGF